MVSERQRGTDYYRCSACDVFYPAGSNQEGAQGGVCPNCGEAELELVVMVLASETEPLVLLEEVQRLLDVAVCLIPTGAVRCQVSQALILVMSAVGDLEVEAERGENISS